MELAAGDQNLLVDRKIMEVPAKCMTKQFPEHVNGIYYLGAELD